MNLQLAAVILLVICAIVYLARQTWGSFAGRKGGCKGGCGCANAQKKPEAAERPAVLISPQEITLRRRDAGPV